jgi:glycosyltransferase involved in cell wall biosynthesis
LYVSGAARVLGIPEIGAIRNNVTSEIGRDWLGRMSLRQPRWLAANSRAAVKTAQSLGIESCFFLPNVVDTEQFTPPLRRSDGPVKLLAVGRLVQQKRMDRFLRVLGEVQSRSKKAVSGIIVGDGPQRDELKAQARAMKALEFRGALADLVPVYQEADVLVLTSDFEGTPNVVMEAMACGLPVVSTAVGGVTEIVRPEETGLVVPAEDEKALANAVLRLVDDAALREALGAKARESIQRERSLDSLAQHLESLYRHVLA